MNKKQNTISSPKKYLFVILFASFFLLLGFLGVFHFFINDNIILSRGSGFYENEFDLKIWARPGLHIYYSLDGSAPAPPDSAKYCKKIHISDPTDNENVYSAITDISPRFFSSDPSESIYKVPNYKVDKCVPLRVAAYNDDGEKVSEVTATYWIGFNDKGDGCYDDLYMVSLVTDPANLFDYEKGIYVTGKIYDDYQNGIVSEYIDDLSVTPANYLAIGRDWERESQITIFSPYPRTLVCDSPAGIRIKGCGSAKNAQKSLKLFSREEYSGSDEFPLFLFGRTNNMHRLVLFNGGSNEEFTKLTEWLVQSIVKDSNLKIGAQAMTPATLFIDGEYWGVCYIAEDLSPDYIKNYYGVDSDNLILVKEGNIVHGYDDDKKKYYSLVYDFVEQYGTTDDYFGLICQTYIDIESCVDYYATEVYIANMDWPINNSELWRARETNSSEYMDGKWRWLLFDVSYLTTMSDPKTQNLSDAMERDALFENLMKNPTFQQMFYDKLDQLENEIFSWENVSRYTAAWQDLMEEPLEKNSLRFAGDKNAADIDGAIKRIQYFCENRGPEIKRQFHEIVDEIND